MQCYPGRPCLSREIMLTLSLIAYNTIYTSLVLYQYKVVLHLHFSIFYIHNIIISKVCAQIVQQKVCASIVQQYFQVCAPIVQQFNSNISIIQVCASIVQQNIQVCTPIVQQFNSYNNIIQVCASIAQQNLQVCTPIVQQFNSNIKITDFQAFLNRSFCAQ